MSDAGARAGLEERVDALLAAHDPGTTERDTFLDARYDAGLAWVHVPDGHGGLGLPRALQPVVDARLGAAGAPDNDPRRNGIGLGMAAPTILAFGTPEQQRRFLRPLWTGREIWCQLFSEPGAGSDLAAVATRAVPDGDRWRVTGQKVWTSSAHLADRALLLARTDPDAAKHRGLTYFALDMRQPGVEVRPLRQLTGEAEFNEVFLTDAVVEDADRLGDVGAGWQVATATLMSERVAIGSGAAREAGMLGVVTEAWRTAPEHRTADAHQRLLRLWVESEALRATGLRLSQKLAAGAPGPEGSAMKLGFARLAQQLSSLEVELRGDDGLRYDDWTMRRPDLVDMTGRDTGYRYLRAKGNSIEGGTSEVLRNIIAERVLGLPSEHRVDKDVAWKDLPR